MKKKVARAWALASSCLVVGCNDDHVAADGSGSGTGGSDTATDESSSGEPPFDGVRLNTVVTFVDADGVLSMGSISPFEYFGGWTVEMGTGAAREIFTGYYDPVGWFEVPGVPEGPYLLRRVDGSDMSWFLALDLREIEADGRLRAGRSTAVWSWYSNTLLTLDVSSMRAVEDADSFELYSRNVDALDTYINYGGVPALGSTSIDGWVVSWGAQNIVGQTPAVDPAAGDDLWLTHLVAVPLVAEPPPDDIDDAWVRAQSRRLVEVAALELDEALYEDVSAEARGSFVPVTAEPVSLDLRLERFHAELRSIVGSQLDSVETACSAQIVLAPGEEVPVDGMTPSLASVWVDNRDGGPPPGDRVVELRAGNPFGSGTEMLVVGCTAWSHVTHPELHNRERAEVELWLTRPLRDGGLVELGLAMPSDIRIGGEPCGIDDVLTGVGTTPTVSLSSPSLGTADYYEITVVQLTGSPFGDSPYRVGGVETTATTFTLPEGLLQPDHYYRLEIAAHSGRRLGEGRAYSHAQHRNTATSGAFTP